MRRGQGAILVLAALASGCATRPVPIEQQGDPVITSLAAATGRAATAARLLAEADAAQDQPQRLGTLIAALDTMGVRPAADTADPMALWRQRAELPRTAPYRGRVLGPAYRAGTLDPGGSVRLPQLFDGGRAARVAVATRNRALVDLIVLDTEAKPVCPPGKAASRECNWTPLFSSRFEIVLTNASGTTATYYLVID
jgi:hypothetical protein